MIDLLIIADDLTGSLDAAIHFSKRGVKTAIFLQPEIDWNHIADDARVLVIHTNTRHLPPEQAYRIVQACAAKAQQKHIPILFKKIDSALRGCVCAELEALLDGSGSDALFVLPSFPAGSRLCTNGIQHWNSIPIAQTAYGQDPLDPVRVSSVPQLLREQKKRAVRLVREAEPFTLRTGITVFDAQSDETLRLRCRMLLRAQRPLLLAGCAGLADALAAELGWNSESSSTLPQVERLLLISGSLHQVSRAQVAYAHTLGYPLFTFALSELEEAQAAEKVSAAFSRAPVVLVQTKSENGMISVEQSRLCSQKLAKFTQKIYQRVQPEAIAVFGGDTLLNISEMLFQNGLYPCNELAQGVPISIARDQSGRSVLLISKSGGFGEESIIEQIADYLLKQKRGVTI